jgi:hypothetical protein
VTADQRDKLLDLHRTAVKALDKLRDGGGRPEDYRAYYAADDAFREYLYSLPVVDA